MISRSMTSRPLHRWKTLWFGILILVFLVWGWARSQSHFDFVNYHFGTTSGDGFSNSGGYVTWASNTFISIPPSPTHVRWGSIAVINNHWFPPPIEATRSSGTASSRYSIAHWLLILLFLLPWSAFLTWRWRRSRHRTKSTVSPAPDA